jgi:hypothetical protein
VTVVTKKNIFCLELVFIHVRTLADHYLGSTSMAQDTMAIIRERWVEYANHWRETDIFRLFPNVNSAILTSQLMLWSKISPTKNDM